MSKIGKLNKPIFTENTMFKGRQYEVLVYLFDPATLPKVDQAQAVCFTKKDEGLFVVLFKHKDGHMGLAGGGLERGESVKDALQREIHEEVNCNMLDYGWIGYELVRRLDQKKVAYFCRYWALVELIHGKVKDPDKKALERVVVPCEDAIEKLGWGKKGEIWIEEAHRKFCTRSMLHK